jgi:predicted nucleotidyltransferase
VSFESVWLFGSGAVGRETPDSDIDVGVIMREAPKRFEIELELMKTRRSVDLRIEPHVLTVEEWESPFYGQAIRKTGIRVG